VVEMFEEDALLEIQQKVDSGLFRPVGVLGPVCAVEHHVERFGAVTRYALSHSSLSVGSFPSALLEHLLGLLVAEELFGIVVI
jgi:hypothetical protein